MGEPHFGFIIAAYAVTAVVIAATIVAVALDYRAQKQAVARLSRVAERASSSSLENL